LESLKLSVFLGGDLAGRLWLDGRGRFVFQYDGAWLQNPGSLPLSVSLPLRDEVYADDEARPFFANLLPEGEIRLAIAQGLGVSEENDFKLLEALGGECAGAVALLPEGSAPEMAASYRPLSDASLQQMIVATPRRPLIVGRKGLRLSLAGAQEKVAVYLEGKRLFLPLAGSVSSHILKPQIPRFPGTVENEAYCMQLARRSDLPVPESFIRTGAEPVYVVERYDRVRNAAGKLERIHQEDFCQALGVPPGQKYESEGGPTFARCMDLVARVCREPARDQMTLLRWLTFNLVVGNADAHAKNLSLLIDRDGFRLAPFCDMLCTAVYPELSARMAMKVGGENRPEWVQKRHWERLAGDLQVKPRLLLDLCREMAEKVCREAAELKGVFVAAHGRKKVITDLAALIDARSARLLRSARGRRVGGS